MWKPEWARENLGVWNININEYHPCVILLYIVIEIWCGYTRKNIFTCCQIFYIYWQILQPCMSRWHVPFYFFVSYLMSNIVTIISPPHIWDRPPGFNWTSLAMNHVRIILFPAWPYIKHISKFSDPGQKRRKVKPLGGSILLMHHMILHLSNDMLL
jgi:hypothetical protein